MKYFSPAWDQGDLTDEQEAAIRDAYWAKVAVLEQQWPPEIRELAHTNLHDGLIRRISLDEAAQRLEIWLRCGDLQVGYFDVTLVYRGLDTERLDRGLLRAIATDPETEVRYDEVDIDSHGRFVHSVRFWPENEIDLVFRELEISREPRADRELGDVASQYHEKPSAA